MFARFVPTLALSLCLLPARPAPAADIAPTGPQSPADERRQFHLPPGFEAQLVAAEPDIHKPMNIAFDARGRLWVTDTVEYPFPVKDGATGRDTVKILEDFGPDGRARKVTTFAAGLNIPIGLLPVEEGKSVGVIVYSIPAIQKFLDTDGDGKADAHSTLLTGFAHDDTHGMTNNFVRGFDGRVYADHGFKNESTVTGTDGSSITMNSGNTYRFDVDGSHVEIFAHGQVNPFGLCFDPLGNLFSADCHSRPQYMLLQGAFYPSFGKPDDGLGFGPEMCTHDHGSTAIAGTLYYAAEQFPPEYRGRLFNGNVVTNAIDSDRIEWHESSPKAIGVPPLLRSDDPWFRPVQVKLGPDGAVYVADFYNKIIGHYEVDLHHPGRDRTSGRIWRIVYKGDAAQAPPPRMPNLAAMSVKEHVAALADPNLTVRLLATDHLADTGEPAAVEPLRQALAGPKTADQHAHALWALRRLGALRPADLAAAAADSDRTVRTHAMRILADLPKWDDVTRALATGGLTDADPFVRRCAAEALGRHPDAANLRPLLDLPRATAKDDTHLLHVARIALRNTIAAPGAFAQFPLPGWRAQDEAAVAEAAVAVPTAEAASFLVKHLAAAPADRAAPAKILRHAARYVPAADVDGLAALAAAKFADDADFQLELFQSVLDGLSQRGGSPGPGLSAWGRSLAANVLAAAPEPIDWTPLPLAGAAASADPWTVQTRKSADGKDAPFLSSLPRGEKLTGVLRSKPFALPARLTFWMAGHNGAPPAQHPLKNVVRLRAEGGDDVLMEAAPPRNDVARQVTWDLKAFAGRRGYLEATDGDAGTAYAWLAFGRFEPPVAAVPAAGPDDVGKRQEAAARIAAGLKLADLFAPLQKLATGTTATPAARTAAAQALVQIDPPAATTALAAALGDAAAPAPVRQAAASALAPIDADAARAALVNALQTTPEGLQKSIATALAGTKPGAEALLGAVAQGKASPRLLQEKAVLDRLKTANPNGLAERVAALTKGMPTADEAIQKLIDNRRIAFDSARAAHASLNPARGREVFVKNCAACHQIGGEGARIGPQLDGIGKRGPDRLAEDILDPSRNVDAAFRYSILTLDDGDVVNGLFRRDEGETAVFADAQGKEFSVPRMKIKKRVESPLSLMPGNLGDVIQPEEFNDLMAYLVTK